jgi:general stress protein 26
MIVQNIKHLLHSWFDFPQNKLFCQVSTVDDGHPHIRTMDLHDFTNDGSLIFLTKTDSRKWNDLTKHPYIAACMLNLDVGQITVEGSVLLHTAENNLATTAHYWENYLPKYWQDFYLSHSSQDMHSLKIPPHLELLKLFLMRGRFWKLMQGIFLRARGKGLR